MTFEYDDQATVLSLIETGEHKSLRIMLKEESLSVEAGKLSEEESYCTEIIC